jgi:hypothetical protein
MGGKIFKVTHLRKNGKLVEHKRVHKSKKPPATAKQLPAPAKK